MREHGISVMAFDLRGHGLSEGKRGLVLSWKEFREDVRAAAAEMSRRNPTLPLFILGHSLGGAIVLDYIQDAEIKPRGAVISAPALGTPGISPLLLAVAGMLSAVAPRLVFSTGLDSDAISSIPEECQKYRDDPLVHGKACVRLSTELKAAQNRIFERAASMITPLLLTHGSADRIAPLEPVEEFFRAAGSGDKTLKVIEGAFHEIHNDTTREEVYRLYSGWIGGRT
jgi:alpha-beta hydrolase superfamily lysophospholipase